MFNQIWLPRWKDRDLIYKKVNLTHLKQARTTHLWPGCKVFQLLCCHVPDSSTTSIQYEGLWLGLNTLGWSLNLLISAVYQSIKSTHVFQVKFSEHRSCKGKEKGIFQASSSSEQPNSTMHSVFAHNNASSRMKWIKIICLCSVQHTSNDTYCIRENRGAGPLNPGGLRRETGVYRTLAMGAEEEGEIFWLLHFRKTFEWEKGQMGFGQFIFLSLRFGYEGVWKGKKI